MIVTNINWCRISEPLTVAHVCNHKKTQGYPHPLPSLSLVRVSSQKSCSWEHTQQQLGNHCSMSRSLFGVVWKGQFTCWQLTYPLETLLKRTSPFPQGVFRCQKQQKVLYSDPIEIHRRSWNIYIYICVENT